MNKKGVTLMELLIVVIIIAGLAAMTYPSYRSSIERARASEAVNMLGAIQAAQQKHFINYEEYGTTFRDINDFEPSIKKGDGNFDPTKDSFDTDYFRYTLGSEKVKAERLNSNGNIINKGYDFEVFYNEDFIRCTVLNGSEDGEKVCSSLTDREKIDTFYPIF